MEKSSLRGSLVKTIIRTVLLESISDTPLHIRQRLHLNLNGLLKFKTIVSDINQQNKDLNTIIGTVMFETESGEYAILDINDELIDETV